MFLKKLLTLLLLFTSALLFADYAVDSNGDQNMDIWVEEFDNGSVKISRDTNFDKKIDTALEMDRAKLTIYEESDFNLDGNMDNFYYYNNGYIVRQEVDSNYDQKIDVWVYIVKNGKVISKYEKDLDYDGTIDKVKEFEIREEEKDGQ